MKGLRVLSVKPLRLAIPAAVLLLASLACIVSPLLRSSLVFSPDALPAAQVNQPYSVDITVSKNATPMFEAGVADGSLPDGLTVELQQDENLVRISGTPTEAGTYTFTISVACYGTNVSGQTGTKDYTLVVNP